MAKKKFDVDRFVAELEELDMTDLDGFDERARYVECPRCGSDTWESLTYSKRTGKPNACNECKDDHEQ